MIQFFSNFSKGWGAKLILTFLAISMAAIWGLGGFLNTNVYGTNTAAKVGAQTISMQTLTNEFNVEKQRLSMMMGGTYLSNKKAIEAGLLDQTVQKLVMESVQDQVADQLGLSASNESVRKYVERNPVFADALGNFDKNMFYAYLSQSRMSESQLAKKLQKELAFQHLTNTVRELGYAPAQLVDLAYRFQNEKRDVEFAVINARDITVAEKPTAEQLREYYDAYAEELIQPEYRTLSVVVLTPDMMLDRVVVDDADIDAVFTEKKAAAVIPEKRALLQIRTDDESKAKDLMKGLTAANFEQVAIDKGGQTKDQTNFGQATKQGMLEELAGPVFAAKKGAIVGPIESPLGWHIFYVKDITPAVTPSDAVIRVDIKKQLAGEKTYDTMYETARKLEDILGAGDSLDWAADQLKLKIQKIPAVNVMGQDLSGKDIQLKNTTMLQEAFTLKKGQVSSLIEQNGGYLVARVDEIAPAHPKEFKDVQGDLVKIWKRKQQEDKLKPVMDKILKIVRSGSELKTLGTFASFKVVDAKSVTREKNEELPTAAVETVFGQEKGNKNATLTPTPEGMVIAIVKNITLADPKKDEMGVGVVAQNLKGAVGDTLVQDVISSYADKIGIKIERAAIEKTFATFAKGDE